MIIDHLRYYVLLEGKQWLFKQRDFLSIVEKSIQKVECCGHLSAFTIRDEQYESNPDPDCFWEKLSRSMNYRLKDVVDVGDSVLYEYDFGSTTELMLKIHSCREGEKRMMRL